jgi:hypothetical protein
MTERPQAQRNFHKARPFSLCPILESAISLLNSCPVISRGRINILYPCLLVLFLLLSGTIARSQSSFTIPVQNTNGVAITGATVTLACTDSAGGCAGLGPYSASSVNGNAVFTSIPAGNYTVTTSGPGIISYSYAYTVAAQPNGGTERPSNLNGTIFVDGVTYPKTDAGFTSALAAAGTNGTVVITPGSSVSITSNHTMSAASLTVRCEPGATFSFAANVAITISGTADRMENCQITGPGTGVATIAPIVISGIRVKVKGNTVTNFGNTSGNGTVAINAGSGHEVSNNWILNNADIGLFVNNQTASSTISDTRIENNHIGNGIIVHTTAASSNINHTLINGNLIYAAQNSNIEFCEELGAFGGNAPNDSTSASNVCYLTASGGDGGFSFSTANDCTETGDVFNASGFTFTVASFEHVILTNCTISGTVSNNGVGGNGLTCDRCSNSTFTGNTVNGFATGASSYGFHLVVSGTTTPSSNDNSITGNVIVFPAAGAGIGIWLQCNATGANCNNNVVSSNHVLGTGNATSQGIELENDVGTMQNNLVSENQITSVNKAVNISGTVGYTLIGPEVMASVSTTYAGGPYTNIQRFDPQNARLDFAVNSNATLIQGTGNAIQSPAGLQGALLAITAGSQDVGSTSLPFGNLWLGTAATNNFKFQPAATAAARVISIPDPLAAENLALIDSITANFIPKAASSTTSRLSPSLESDTGTVMTYTGTGGYKAAEFIANQGSVCTNGELALSANWGASATATAVAGTGQTCQWTITANGTTGANPTVTDTLTNALPAATTVCDMHMVGGTGTATLINQTSLSATAPIFTFGGTPVSLSTYIVVRRCGP